MWEEKEDDQGNAIVPEGLQYDDQSNVTRPVWSFNRLRQEKELAEFLSGPDPNNAELLRFHDREDNRASSLISQMRLPLPAGESNRREEVVREKLNQSYPYRLAGKRIMDEERWRLRDIQEGVQGNEEAFNNFVIDTHLTRPTLSEATRNEIMGMSNRQRSRYVSDFAQSSPDEERQRMMHIENNYPDYDNQINNFQSTAEGFRTALRDDIIEQLVPYSDKRFARHETDDHRMATMQEGRRLLRHQLSDLEMLYADYLDRKNTGPNTHPALVSFRRKLLKIQEGIEHQSWMHGGGAARTVEDMLFRVKAPKVTANKALRKKWVAGVY